MLPLCQLSASPSLPAQRKLLQTEAIHLQLKKKSKKKQNMLVGENVCCDLPRKKTVPAAGQSGSEEENQPDQTRTRNGMQGITSGGESGRGPKARSISAARANRGRGWGHEGVECAVREKSGVAMQCDVCEAPKMAREREGEREGDGKGEINKSD